MRFKDYVEQRDIQIHEADMPPPAPPAMVRSFEHDSAPSSFHDAIEDAKAKHGNDMRKVIQMASYWQPSEKDSPGFVRALKKLAKKNGVSVNLPSWLQKFDSSDTDDDSPRGFQVNFPGKDSKKNLGLAAYHNYRTGNEYFDSAFKHALENNNGNLERAVRIDLANWQPSEQEKDAFVSSLRKLARRANLGDVQLAHHLLPKDQHDDASSTFVRKP